MSKVIAVFGAGTGLGIAVARRFGRQGFRVALVARRHDRLDALVGQLAAESVESAAFPADLSEPAGIPALMSAIRDRFGSIDVIEYGPKLDGNSVPAAKLDAATLQGTIPLLLLTPVETVRAALPEWTERGDGAFLMATGYSAVEPMPYISGVSTVMAAARHYVYSLNAELANTGIYAGTLSVAGMIAGSETAAMAAADERFASLPVVNPDDLADCYWEMYTKRDHVERIHPQPQS